ncbi:MAG: hypothetical protein NPIRA02_02330 [Nitrospirales bacterium]|nr:MAG: hypothetical protein NPIRA02_02330 [Nitrospirales bacterium]
MPNATAAQIKEIEGFIEKEKKASDDKLQGPDSKEAKKNYQTAIELADKYFKIKLHPNCFGEPEYKHSKRVSGSTVPRLKDGKPKGQFTIGEKAFFYANKPSAIWLAATKVHEILGHCANGFKVEMQKGLGTDEEFPMATQNLPEEEDEFLAYKVMLEWEKKLGLTEAMKKGIKDWMKYYYKGMSKEKQAKYKKEFPWLALRQTQQEFNGVLANVMIPGGALVQSRYGIAFKTETTTSVAELVVALSEGDVTEFYALNPELPGNLQDSRPVNVGTLDSISVELDRSSDTVNVSPQNWGSVREAVKEQKVAPESKASVLLRR